MKALKYFTCIFLLAFSSRIYSQIPDTLWTKTFGGPLSDIGVSVKQTNDGGFIIAATTSSFGAGGQDIWLIKTNENGDTLWTKTFGGTGNDRASNVEQTDDDGYAVFGTTNSFGNGGDDFLMWKTDSLGNTEWFKTYGGTPDEIAYEGHQLIDGTYVIVGDSVGQYTKAWLIKTDSEGNFLWGRTIGTNSYGAYFWGRSALKVNDGGYVLCGTHRYAYGPSYVYEYSFTKISSSGDSLFYRYYGMFSYAFCSFVRKLSDGNLIIGGFVGITDAHPWILKTNQSGISLWQKTVVGSQSTVSLKNIESTTDNGFIMTVGSVGTSDIQIVKADENGIFSWEKIIGGPQDDRAYSVSLTYDSGYIVTGYTKSFGAGDSDIWLLKFNYPPPEISVTNPNGGEFWLVGSSQYILWTSNEVDSVKIELSLDNGVGWYTIADSIPSNGEFEWIAEPPQTSRECKMRISYIKDSTIFDESDSTFVIDILPSVSDSSNSLPTEFSLLQNYPNPFNPSTIIQYEIPYQVRNDSRLVTLKVYDVLGNEVATLVNEEKQPGTYEVEFSAKGGSASGGNAYSLPSGIYFYQLKAGDYIETKKMVVIK
jgi:hypothetical protein